MAVVYIRQIEIYSNTESERWKGNKNNEKHISYSIKIQNTSGKKKTPQKTSSFIH